MQHTDRVTLRYPNGRTHNELLTTREELSPGSEFELYGHRWHALGWVSDRSRYNRSPPSLLCEPAETPAAKR